MDKVVISVLGADRPGIVAAVSRVLLEHRCNIEDVSQTILQSEFAGIFIASIGAGLTSEALTAHLEQALAPIGLLVTVKPLGPRLSAPPPASEPFVVTTIGPDRLGLVAGITEIMADFGVNITTLKAAFRGGDDPHRNIMVYEVDIPTHIDRQAFRHALRERAATLGLDLSLQHRQIFEAIQSI